MKSAEVLRLRGDLLPLIRLSQVLRADLPTSSLAVNSQTGAHRDATHIIVVETGQLRYGLVVDSVQDSEEIVVKPLGRHLKKCEFLAGATVLGDGCVAMILDVAGIAAETHLRAAQDDKRVIANENSPKVKSGQEQQTLLLLNNNPTDQFAMPMSLIARIERINADEINHVGEKELLQYQGKTLPLLRLENFLHCQPLQSQRQYFVVVFKIGGHEVGLLAAELLDIRTMAIEIDTSTFDEPCTYGSCVIDQRITRFIDLHKLIRAIQPAEAAKSESHSVCSEDRRPARILLVEDSDFFRRAVRSILEEFQYQVVPCEDGRVAIDALRNGKVEVDLVLTDIEMPNINGVELTRLIRQDAQFSHLPIIALTSLAGAADEARAREAGVDDYQTKMDRDRLIAAIREQLARHTSSRRDTPASLSGAST